MMPRIALPSVVLLATAAHWGCAASEVPADLGFEPIPYSEPEHDAFSPTVRAKVVIRSGDPLREGGGYVFRNSPDFVCQFAGDGGGMLFVNHEIEDIDAATTRPTPQTQNQSGGVTRLDLDPELNVVRSTMHLWQTSNNCSGGVTPWGTFLTCEEHPDTSGKTKIDPPNQVEHMYTWEVAPQTPGVATRLDALGHFSHEGAAFDLDGNVYQTEDQTPGFIYKFVPTTRGRLAEGGTLYALDAVHRHWIKIEDPRAAHDDALRRGATPFPRPEGIDRHPHQPDWVYFAVTGSKEEFDHRWGDYRYGAVLALNVRTLELREVVVGREETGAGGVFGTLQKPDNIRFDSNGNLYILEDHDNEPLDARDADSGRKERSDGRNEILVWHAARRKLYRFAVMGPGDSEWTGPWFANTPAGKTLFVVNQLNPGTVYAITGFR